MIDESKYNNFFLDTLKANPSQYYSEYDRVMKEYGNSEKTKIAFYTQAFDVIVSQFKNEMPQNRESLSFLIYTHNRFIEILNDDDIDSSNLQKDLEELKNQTYIYDSPRQKKYNLNTKYGRRKWREEGFQEYQKLSAEEKINRNVIGILIVVVICIIMYFILGENGFLKWATR